MINLKHCNLNRLHITNVTLAEQDMGMFMITADYAVFNNEGLSQGCSGRMSGPWGNEVTEKIRELTSAMEKELMRNISGEGEEEDGSSRSDSDRGSVQGIPGGLRPKLGDEGTPIEQL